MYYAHSLEHEKDKARWQLLSDHSYGTGREAAFFAQSFGAEKAAMLAGLLHDLGKYCAAFQARLEGSAQPVDHAAAGAIEVRDLVAGSSDPWDRKMGDILAYAIAGHHGGLPDWQGLSDRLKRELPSLDPVWRGELSFDACGLKPPLEPHPSKFRLRLAFQLAFLGRMIFSCLVDADFKDTERFYNQAAGTIADRDWPRLPEIIDGLIARYDDYMAAKRVEATPPGKEPSTVNRLRQDVLAHVRGQAAMDTGPFTLTVPTGGGKTLASLGFALDHARRHGLERVVYAIPFTSVLDQTAAVFRDVLGEDVILEHHSAIEERATSSREQRDKLRLAMEDWAAPIILTTNVQLFESLFANRPSRCRKLHNLARSVIILDEAQTLPLSLLKPCVAAIDELTRNYKASAVLCTATQPALDQRDFATRDDMGLDLKGRELAPDPNALAAQLARVTLRHAGILDDDHVIGELADHPQALIIVNTRKHALALYRRGQEAGLEGLIHLSTRQYSAHRRRILDDVRQRLEDGLPCRLIATSLVEAGVDLDFPRLWRAEAGLDQIAQAAGRCNREGRRPVEDSIVTVFCAPDDPPPRAIAQLAASYTRVAAKLDRADLFTPKAYEDYFREVYWSKGPALDSRGILQRFKVDSKDVAFEYKRVAEDFQMIESGMVPVIIARGPAAQEALGLLGREGVSVNRGARLLQPFLVQIPPRAFGLLAANGHVSFIHERMFGDQFAVLKTDALYQDDTGLLWENADYLDLEQSIF